MSDKKNKLSLLKQIGIMAVSLLAIFQVGRAIHSSIDRQIFLHKQTLALKAGEAQAEEINKELRDGLSSYRSSAGIERLARERLNLAGTDEVIIRIAK
jgi:cell division protein FtsB